MTNPGVRLRVGHQHSRFLLILTRFVDYYSPFCGPKAISMVVEPQVVLMCWSSTITVLAGCGPFHGPLLTVLGSRSDFHDSRTLGVRLHVVHQHAQFWPILAHFVDYYSLFWAPGVISTINEPCGALTCRSSTLAVFVDSDPFRGLLLTVLWSRSDFHAC